MRNIARLALAAALALTLMAPAAWAQAWPGKPIKLINGFPPGGGADILARLVAERLSGALGQQVIVENRTGATGMIAAQSVAASAPDGYTILFYTMNMACTSPIMPGNKINIDPDKDLMPIVIIAGLDNLLYVSPKTDFKTVEDVIKAAKANPGKLTYGSSGVGGSYHLWAAQFTTMAEIEMLHVPFRGGPPAIAEIVAGRVDMMFGNLAEILPHIRSGAVRAVAFTSVPPSPVLPGVPTIAQSGLPDYRADNWFGLGAPAGTSQEIVDRLNAEVNKLVKDPAFAAKLVSLGFQPTGGTVADMKATILRDRAKWKAVIDANNIRAE
ncbi:Bug family tripartite tricarboxylate transporter substrate binding protein [Reyranella sp.]|uniref:Bug family tripartite tricarboxylate transporter substrate binding protein n=1 Tax=Reyranella sp. TaxID=1929291 RepID=UPI003BA8D9E0